MDHSFDEEEALGLTGSRCTIENAVDPYVPLCRHLALQALVELGGFRNSLTQSHCTERSLFDFLGVSLTDEAGDYSRDLAIEGLKRALRESAHPGWPEATPILINARWLQGRVGLNEVESRILFVVLLSRKVDALARALCAIGGLNMSALVSVFSLLVDASTEDVARALANDGRLARSRLLRVDHASLFDFGGKLDLINGLTDRIETVHGDPFELFAGNFSVGQIPELDLGDYLHLQPQLNDLADYLRDALATGRTGVNILIYGPPGTGKTQVSRALAAAVGARLFEVATVDGAGVALAGPRRLASYALSQEILATAERSIILFDEIEDISPNAGSSEDEDGWGHAGPRRHGNKAWLNNLLESNRTPALWVSNRVGHIDAAHRRRFDLPFFVDVPPASIRARFLARYARPLGASAVWCERVSRDFRFSPAAISRAARFAQGVLNVDPARGAEHLFEEAFAAHVQLAQGRRPKFKGHRDVLDYRYDVVNASVDLQHLVDGLRVDSCCRIALVGPSGTGKSEFARQVAHELDKPLMVQRASDLLRPHVGESEEAIAEMFEQATRDEALLLIDEVDSFLRSRADLKQNWESTMVNEMLTQLEEFQGTLFVTSNWAERLDQASLRRFDLKVEFDYMRTDQALEMLKQLCERLEVVFDSALVRPGELESMTPGLFSLIARQARFRPVTDLRDLMGRLRAEALRGAGDARRPMGFLVPVAA